MFILDSLANYTPRDEREAQSICERITPRLAHANAAVVLSAVKVFQTYEFRWKCGKFIEVFFKKKVLMKYMEMMARDADFVSGLSKKLSPPLVTLVKYSPMRDDGFA